MISFEHTAPRVPQRLHCTYLLQTDRQTYIHTCRNIRRRRRRRKWKSNLNNRGTRVQLDRRDEPALVAITLILQNSAQQSLEKIAACWQQRGDDADDAWKKKKKKKKQKKRTIRHWRQVWQHPTAEASEQAFSAAVDSLVEPLAETRAALLFL
jgi:hypothetical protein